MASPSSVVLSQLGVLFGFRIEASGIVPRALEFIARLPATHWPTLAVGLATIALLLLLPRVSRRLPATLVALVGAGFAVHFLGLEEHGVRTIGAVPSGFPIPRVPEIPLDTLPILIAEAAGLALVMFSTTMLAARSFADRNRYEIDADREIAALGAANIAAAFAQGFVVTGTNSRTALGEVAGGRTQMAGIVTAVVIAVVVAFFTWPLQYIPAVSLAALLVVAGASLFNWRNVAAIGRIDRREYWIAMTATVGVIVVGVMNAILLAIVLALMSFVQLASRPKVERLGTIDGQSGFYSLARHPEASSPEGSCCSASTARSSFSALRTSSARCSRPWQRLPAFAGSSSIWSPSTWSTQRASTRSRKCSRNCVRVASKPVPSGAKPSGLTGPLPGDLRSG